LLKFFKKGQKIKKILILTLLLSIVSIFTIFTLTYFTIKAEEKNYELNKKVIFYEIYNLSSKLLEEIMKEYYAKKEAILKANDFVIKNLDKNITELKRMLGKNYHIYITDKNLTITNTTFKYDQNFSLKFAKDIFLKHKKFAGISPPICEPATTYFISFSDRYINKRVVQVGYIIENAKIKKIKEEIKKIKSQNPFIKDITLFFIHPKTHYAQECKFLTPLKRKYSLKEMVKMRKEGLDLYKQLLHKNPLFTKDSMYILKKDPFSEGYIIFKLTLNQTLYKKEIQKVVAFTGLASSLIILLIIAINLYIRHLLKILYEFSEHIKKEQKFENQKEFSDIILAYNNTLTKLQDSITAKEDFIHYALHELSTPINILALYASEYEELKPSIKKLLSSYNNIAYFIHDIKKEKTKFNLKDLVIDRIKLFSEIAKIENKTIISDLEDFEIEANKEDIATLIDNNIKNAIKYSTSNLIKITLKDGILTFQNDGIIKDKSKIFEKFYREDKIKGGFGIGLFIIKKIADNYGIKIKVDNDNKIIFSYDFKGER